MARRGGHLPVSLADAAHLGDNNEVRKFLNAGGAVDALCPERDNGTLLLAAAVGGNLGLTRLLLRRRANVDLQNSAGLSPLMCATWKDGNTDVIETLIHAGAQVEQRNPRDGATAVLYAAERGESSVAKALLRAGANVDAAKADGGTALMAASHQGRLAMVLALLEARPSLDMQNDEGATALHGAAQQGHAPTLAALLQARADPSLRAHGRTALEWAQREGRQECVLVLRRHATALEVAAARARRAEAERAARQKAADEAMAALLEEERLQHTPRPTASSRSAAAPLASSRSRAGLRKAAGGKERRGGGKLGGRRLERQSCPCDGSSPLDAFELDAPAAKEEDGEEDTATGAPARRMLFEEVLSAPRGGSYPLVSDAAQRFLERTTMADEDKRAAAALLARRRRAARHSV